ncbi:dihydrofolate reductase family protein [Frigidibacter sp. ROC022]|uniref:dihydrofolate reductase family protein n=1 Tax=Frigidibacter sp. ROC022 TaxID=2971796 RepID=UPI00215A483F|nr:dihydrofolate reductase family protein [Frigidibacter sp. ROC022]MCR8725347.1 dihydrofolate reductase family protein [Frigidibacter sp. ROC022]
MTRLRVHGFTISIDGYGAGPGQDLQNPMGRGSQDLHRWAFKTRTFRTMFGQDGGSIGEDDRLAARGFHGIGAWVMGRNMFTHERGPWANDDWKGWWGDVPPYRCPVYVLTHHPRASFDHGGTTFHFVAEGLDAALEQARAAAGDLDIRLGGGVATLRAALQRGLVDEMHLAVAPILLGGGEALWPGLDLPGLGYRIARTLATPDARHLLLEKG